MNTSTPSSAFYSGAYVGFVASAFCLYLVDMAGGYYQQSTYLASAIFIAFLVDMLVKLRRTK